MQNYLLKFSRLQLQVNPPVLNNSVFAEGFENWSGNIKSSGSNLLVNLGTPHDSGGTDFLLLLRNEDNSRGNEYLK